MEQAAHEKIQLRSHARITALGAYVPARRMDNVELERLVDTSDEWIVQRTGIRERRIAAADEQCSDLCVAAALNLVERSGAVLDDVDFIIVATSTPDAIVPSVASQVQAKLNLGNCGALDIQAACAGFTYGLQLANGLLLSGMHRKILVIGAEVLSKATDYTDRTTCILFGDGAGAVLVEAPQQQEASSFIASYVHTDGKGGHNVYRSSLSTRIGQTDIITNGKLLQNGREVYKWALQAVPQGMKTILAQAGLATDDIDWFIPHSSNMRMIEAICERSGMPIGKTLTSLEYYGNTSAASIPLALHLGVLDGRVKQGDRLLLYGFGGGLTEAGLILTWVAPNS